SHGVDLDGVTPDAITGTIKYDKPPLPAVVDRRVIAVFLDRNKSNGLEIYWAIGFPRANVTRNGEQELQKEEGGLSWPLTATGLLDGDAGTATSLFWGGPGLADLVEPMGFDAA